MHSTSLKLAIVLVLLNPFVLGAAAWAAGPSTEESAVREAVVARLKSLGNLIVEYDQEDTHTPPPELLKMNGQRLGKGAIQIEQGTLNTHCIFRFLGDRAWFERRRVDPVDRTKSEIFAVDHLINVLFPDHVEQLVRQPGNKVDLGSIRQRSDNSLGDETIDVALGLRAEGSSAWLTADDIAAMNVDVHTQSGDVVLTDTRQAKIVHSWDLDPKRGYAVIGYTVRTPDQPFPSRELGCEQFHTIGGVVLPALMTSRWVTPGKDGKPLATLTSTIAVKRVQVDTRENTPESYELHWSDGTLVWDMTTGDQFVIEPPDAGKASADRSSPKGALRALVMAARAGDADGMKSVLLSLTDDERKLENATIEAQQAMVAIADAMIEQFGASSMRQRKLNEFLPGGQSNLFVVDQATEQIQGDSATLKLPGMMETTVKMVRIGSEWKAPMSQMVASDTVKRNGIAKILQSQQSMADRLTALAADVHAGKFATAKEVRDSLKGAPPPKKPGQ